MARKKQIAKTPKAKKATEKIEKKDQIAEVAKQVDIPREGMIEEDQSTLPKKDLFRIDEVAQYFDVTERTVRLWIDHGHLKAVKKVGVIRILRDSILKCRILERREIM